MCRGCVILSARGLEAAEVIRRLLMVEIHCQVQRKMKMIVSTRMMKESQDEEVQNKNGKWLGEGCATRTRESCLESEQICVHIHSKNNIFIMLINIAYYISCLANRQSIKRHWRERLATGKRQHKHAQPSPAATTADTTCPL